MPVRTPAAPHLLAGVLTASLLCLAAPPRATAQVVEVGESAQAPTMEALLAQGSHDSIAPTEQAPALPTSQKSGSASLLLFLFGAALVGVAGVGAARYGKKKKGGHAQGKGLKHIQSMRLGSKHQVSLVEVHGQTLVIGLTDGHISLLDKLSPVQQAPKAAKKKRKRAQQAQAPSQALAQDASPARQDAPAEPDLLGAWGKMFDEAIEERQHELSQLYPPLEPLEELPEAPDASPLAALADRVGSQFKEDSAAHDGLFSTFESSVEEVSHLFSEASIARHEEQRFQQRQQRSGERREESSRESDSVLIALRKFREVAG